ncbi:MAG: superoxide dismutase [Proteobacteria bacterium]|nr:superoxide dismutase [Pseudomonadota bacterium]
MEVIELPTIPYDLDSLEPAITREALWLHLLRLRRACFEPACVQVRDAHLGVSSLEELIRYASPRPALRTLYEQACSLWNHDLYWRSMIPAGGGEPRGDIAELIRCSFGSHRDFVRACVLAAQRVHGSGWLWLTWEAEHLALLTTLNSDPPFLVGANALLGLDLWEHAYYLDYQNRRSAYVTAFLEDLVDWNFANSNLRRARRM